MKVEEISLPNGNPFVQQYITNAYDVKRYFDYNIHDSDHLKERLSDLEERVYPREELSEYLLTFLDKFQIPEKTKENILALKEKDTYVVVGGQQAGLLTGPLYSIHKIISIIQLAKKYEEELQVKVVPVFWVAGEDHDIDEINHVYVSRNHRVKKTKLYSENTKEMASQTNIDQKQTQKWVNDIISTLGETPYTEDVQKLLSSSLEQSDTYVDFFIRLIFELFKDTGIVLMDSGDFGIRELEAPYFTGFVNKSKFISKALMGQQDNVMKDGFVPQLQISENCANLFLNMNGERNLLERDGEDGFVTKDGKLKVTHEELIHITENEPERLSNNVVTRPLMQEYLLPTLAFIGGPGELAYWGELKGVFAVNGLKMPPVFPRQMITILERHIAKEIELLQISIEDVLVNSIQDLVNEFVSSKEPVFITDEFTEAKAEMKIIHNRLKNIVEQVDRNLENFAIKNEKKINEQIDILMKKLDGSINKKYEIELYRFGRIEHSIRPNGNYQERVWGIIYYLNKYGVEFVLELLNTSLDWNMKHKVVYI